MSFVKGDPRINRKGQISKPKMKLRDLFEQALAHGDGPLAFFIKLKADNPNKFIDIGVQLLPKEKVKPVKDILPNLSQDELVVAAERVLKYLVSKGDKDAVKFVLQTKGGYNTNKSDHDDNGTSIDFVVSDGD